MLQRTLSNVDTSQILRYVYDDETNSLRLILAAPIDFSLQSSQDSISTQGISISASGSTGGPDSIIIGPLDASGMKSFQLYAKSNGALATGAIGILEVSPSSAGDVWFSTSASLTSGLSSGEVVAGLIHETLAKRVRVKISQLPNSSSVDYFLVMQGN